VLILLSLSDRDGVSLEPLHLVLRTVLVQQLEQLGSCIFKTSEFLSSTCRILYRVYRKSRQRFNPRKSFLISLSLTALSNFSYSGK